MGSRRNAELEHQGSGFRAVRDFFARLGRRLNLRRRVAAFDYAATHQEVFRRVSRRASREEAMSRAVGGSFSAMGAILRESLIAHANLVPDHYVIDVGCGSGRLAKALVPYLRGPLLGTDVVPAVLKYAAEICHRPDWRFVRVTEISIPERDNQADVVVFYSVMTHLLHEDSYRYLCEARRVLKPGGRVVFSFLDFEAPDSWQFFEHMVKKRASGVLKQHDQFVGRDAIAAWARNAGLEMVRIIRAGEAVANLRDPVNTDDGTVLQGPVSMHQSLCVLGKPTP